VAAADADDVAEALDRAWQAVLEAVGSDLAGWDMARVEAEVRPAAT